MQLDVDYVQDPQYGWVPTSWKYVLMDPTKAYDQIARSFHSTVTAWEVNIPIDPSEFELAFPVGTRVSEPNSPTPEYIVTKDGKKRIIPPEDIGATYEQLLNSEPGYAMQPRRDGFVTYAIAIAIALVLILGTMIWLRKKKSP
jgi:hypothetical protein